MTLLACLYTRCYNKILSYIPVLFCAFWLPATLSQTILPTNCRSVHTFEYTWACTQEMTAIKRPQMTPPVILFLPQYANVTQRGVLSRLFQVNRHLKPSSWIELPSKASHIDYGSKPSKAFINSTEHCFSCQI